MTTVRKLVYMLAMRADTSGAKQAKQAADEVSNAWDNLTGHVMRAGVALGAALAGMGFLVKNTAAFAEEVERSARGLSMTTTQFQAYKAGFDALGASTDDLMDAFGTLVDRAVDAQEGSKQYIKEFKRVGIAIDELKGKKPHELFDLYLDRTVKLKDRNQAIASAVRLFGDDLGRRLLPVMVESGESFKSLTKLVEDTGLALDDVGIKRLRQTAFEGRRLEFVVKGLSRDLASELAPAFTKLAHGITEVLAQRSPMLKDFFDEVGEEALKWAEKLVTAIKDVDKAAGDPKGLGKLAEALYQMSLVIGAGMAGIGLLAAVGALGSALTGLSVPIVATFFVVSALVRHLEDLWVYFHGGLSLTGALGSKFEWLESVLQVAKLAFKGLEAELTLLGQDFRELIGIFTQEGPEGFSLLELGLAVVHVALTFVVTTVLALAQGVIFLVRQMVRLATFLSRVGSQLGTFWDTLKQRGLDAYAVFEKLVGRVLDLGRAMGMAAAQADESAVLSVAENDQMHADRLSTAGRNLVSGTLGDTTTFFADAFDGAPRAAEIRGLGSQISAQAGQPTWFRQPMPLGPAGGGPRVNNQDVRVQNVNITIPGVDATDGRAIGRAAAETFQSEVLMSEDIFASGVD